MRQSVRNSETKSEKGCLRGAVGGATVGDTTTRIPPAGFRRRDGCYGHLQMDATGDAKSESARTERRPPREMTPSGPWLLPAAGGVPTVASLRKSSPSEKPQHKSQRKGGQSDAAARPLRPNLPVRPRTVRAALRRRATPIPIRLTWGMGLNFYPWTGTNYGSSVSGCAPIGAKAELLRK